MDEPEQTTDLERFIACMEYKSCDRRPNHELGAWGQTRDRWMVEAPEAVDGFQWSWFDGESALNLDRREYIPVNYGFIPPFDQEVLDETAEYIVARNAKGIVTKALKEGTAHGTRMSMDQYLNFPVATPEVFPKVTKRLVAAMHERYPDDLEERVDRWARRECPLVLGRNCAANGFYWRAREFRGTENLSLAWIGMNADASASESRFIHLLNTCQLTAQCRAYGWETLGGEYRDESSFVEAGEAYQKAIQAMPERHKYWFFLGWSCLKQSRYQDALTAYKWCVQLDSSWSQAHVHLGV